MYSQEITRQLQKLTATLLKKQGEGMINIKEPGDLRAVLRFHEYRYYILNDPLIADYEYDQLFIAYKKLNRKILH